MIGHQDARQIGTGRFSSDQEAAADPRRMAWPAATLVIFGLALTLWLALGGVVYRLLA